MRGQINDNDPCWISLILRKNWKQKVRPSIYDHLCHLQPSRDHRHVHDDDHQDGGHLVITIFRPPDELTHMYSYSHVHSIQANCTGNEDRAIIVSC